jgi:hypothetical protein
MSTQAYPLLIFTRAASLPTSFVLTRRCLYPILPNGDNTKVRQGRHGACQCSRPLGPNVIVTARESGLGSFYAIQGTPACLVGQNEG